MSAVNIVPMATDMNAGQAQDPLVQAMLLQRQRQMSAGERLREAGSRPQPVYNGLQGALMLANGALGGFLEARDERRAREQQTQVGNSVGALARSLGVSENEARAMQSLAVLNPQMAAAAAQRLMERSVNPPARFTQETLPDGTRQQRNERTGEASILQQPTPNFAQETRPDGTVIQRNTRTGETSVVMQPPAPTLATPGQVMIQRGATGAPTMQAIPGGYAPLVTPEDRRAAGIRDDDRGVYQRAPSGRMEAVGTPQQNTTINNVQNPILKGVSEQFVEQRTAARAARQSIGSIHEARALVDAGITTGIGADRRLDLQRVGALFGISDPATVANTEAFRAVMGRGVLAEIRTLGANPSNADREYLEKVVAGNIELNESTIRRVLDIRENAARQSIREFNKEAERMGAAMPDLQTLSGGLSIPEPQTYEQFLAERRGGQQQQPETPQQPPSPSQATPQQPAPARPMEFDFIPGQGLVPRAQQ